MRLLRSGCLFALAFALAVLPRAARGAEHRLKILTSFLPVYCFTVNVAGDLAQVENLLPPGAEPHEFQFTAREMKLVGSADMVVVNGLGLESWLDRVLLASDRPKAVVKLSDGLQSELIKYSTEAANDDRTAPAANAVNPHIWLDPQLAVHAVKNILVALQKADPDNAAGYETNARRYIDRLEKLDADLRAGLAPFHGQAIITFHNAFPYFARRYNLRIAGVVEQIPDVTPSVRYLQELHGVIEQEHVKVLFNERLSSPKLVDQIGHDYHVRVAELDTLETGGFTPEAYETGMRNNLRVLIETMK